MFNESRHELSEYECVVMCMHRSMVLSESIATADIYLFKVNNWNTKTVCEICSKLAIKKPGFIVNFEQISHIVLVFPSLTLNK